MFTQGSLGHLALVGVESIEGQEEGEIRGAFCSCRLSFNRVLAVTVAIEN